MTLEERMASILQAAIDKAVADVRAAADLAVEEFTKLAQRIAEGGAAPGPAAAADQQPAGTTRCQRCGMDKIVNEEFSCLQAKCPLIP